MLILLINIDYISLSTNTTTVIPMRSKHILHLIFILITIISLSCCSPYKMADSFAHEHRFVKLNLQTIPFNMTSWHRIQDDKAETIRIYIEGDGRAYLNGGTRLSSDPTPNNLLLFKAVNLDPYNNLIYLPRPCQFSKQDIESEICKPIHWSQGRYSKVIIDATNQSLNQIKKIYKNKYFELVGFSGGGAIVTLTAATRNDISKIITIAGNLDLKAMDKHHGTSPLIGSLDPINIAQKINHIPQVHFVGTKDVIVPPIIAENFLAASGNKPNIRIIRINASHADGWLGKTYDVN